MSQNLHIICGRCGSDIEFLTYYIDYVDEFGQDTGMNDTAIIKCINCGALTDLADILENINRKKYGR